MVENLQTETLILIVYAIIEIIGICGNLYVICWSICASQKDSGPQIMTPSKYDLLTYPHRLIAIESVDN